MLRYGQPRLRELQCDAAQGYHLGRPMDREMMTAWLRRDTMLEPVRMPESDHSPETLTGVVSALPQYVAGAGDWSSSINIKLTQQLTLSFDAKNITGELARQYVERKDMPAAIYDNGRQFYLGLKYSM